jgi:hypothetical protein
MFFNGLPVVNSYYQALKAVSLPSIMWETPVWNVFCGMKTLITVVCYEDLVTVVRYEDLVTVVRYEDLVKVVLTEDLVTVLRY